MNFSPLTSAWRALSMQPIKIPLRPTMKQCPLSGSERHRSGGGRPKPAGSLSRPFVPSVMKRTSQSVASPRYTDRPTSQSHRGAPAADRSWPIGAAPHRCRTSRSGRAVTRTVGPLRHCRDISLSSSGDRRTALVSPARHGSLGRARYCHARHSTGTVRTVPSALLTTSGSGQGTASQRRSQDRSAVPVQLC